MGCDIHMYVERQRKDGTWNRVSDKMGPKHPYYDETASAEHKEYFNRNDWSTGRNYALFGRLAGVRNWNVKPIARPKGVPSDISNVVNKEYQAGRGDWHTASYFTAKELSDVKDEANSYVRYLSIKTFKEYLASGKTKLPSDGFLWSLPYDMILISEEEMERRCNLLAFWDGEEYYTALPCPIPAEDVEYVANSTNQLFNIILPRMLEIESNPEKIRIVFWFDN